MNILLLLVLSIFPGLAIIVFIYFQDKYEREPIKQLAHSFFYGCYSSAIAYFVTDTIKSYISLDEVNAMSQIFHAFAVGISLCILF